MFEFLEIKKLANPPYPPPQSLPHRNIFASLLHCKNEILLFALKELSTQFAFIHTLIAFVLTHFPQGRKR